MVVLATALREQGWACWIGAVRQPLNLMNRSLSLWRDGFYVDTARIVKSQN